MISEVFITRAVTGGGAVKQANVPITPEQIADLAIEAARAGAAVVHIHVRDPEPRRGSRNPALYGSGAARSDVNPVINLTTGMGRRARAGWGGLSVPPGPAGMDTVGALERLVHSKSCAPEICTLDCGR